MSKRNRSSVNVNPSIENLDTLAMQSALADMQGETSSDVSAILQGAKVETETANIEAIAEATANVPNVIGLDIKTAFVSIATFLLIESKESGIPVENVIAEMEKAGFTFEPAKEGEKTPKGKKFTGCKTEKCANVLYTFLVKELRNKSTVMFAQGSKKGNTLYYTENRIFSANGLPSDSVNAWKESVKLLNTASGK
jgi:hypothetical protein